MRWLGGALVAGALAVLPMVVWVSNTWAIVAATSGVAGIVLLVLARR